MSTRLADFVVDRRMLLMAALAVPIGAPTAGAAWVVARCGWWRRMAPNKVI